MLQPRKCQVSLIDMPYFMNNIPVIHLLEASWSGSNLPLKICHGVSLCVRR